MPGHVSTFPRPRLLILLASLAGITNTVGASDLRFFAGGPAF